MRNSGDDCFENQKAQGGIQNLMRNSGDGCFQGQEALGGIQNLGSICLTLLEEFRKKKADMRAKKDASTGQLISADEDQYGKVSQKYDHVRYGGKTATVTESYGLSIADENKAVISSKSTEIHSSNRAHGSSPVLVDCNHGSYGESIQLAANEVPKLYESSGYPELANVYYDQWKESRELNH